VCPPNRGERSTHMVWGLSVQFKRLTVKVTGLPNTSRVVDRVPYGSRTDCKLGLIIISADLLSTREMLCNGMNGWPHVMWALSTSSFSCTNNTAIGWQMLGCSDDGFCFKRCDNYWYFDVSVVHWPVECIRCGKKWTALAKLESSTFEMLNVRFIAFSLQTWQPAGGLKFNMAYFSMYYWLV